MNNIYVGLDSRSPVAAQVCRFSIQRRATATAVTLIDQKEMRSRALYWRQSKTDHDGILVDTMDGKPFSTEFSFTRFLTPFLHGRNGWAMSCDDDFLFLEDVKWLFALADEKYAVMVVKHRHAGGGMKMDGVPQTSYHRKNWSSLILWNCAHPSNHKLTSWDVNNRSGAWLHAFSWLDDAEIGELPETWNWLVGVSPTTDAVLRPINAVHYTLGGPWFENCRAGQLAGMWVHEKTAMDAGLSSKRTEAAA